MDTACSPGLTHLHSATNLVSCHTAHPRASRPPSSYNRSISTLSAMLCLYPLFAAFLLCINLVTALTVPRDGNLLARQAASPSCSTATLSGWARFPQ